MDFSFTEEEQEVSDLARKILEDKVTHEKLPELEGRDEPRFDRELWGELAKANLLGIALPESVGGSGLSLLAQSLVLEQIGRTLAPVPYLACIAMGADVLAAHGTDAQIDAWVRPAIEGERIFTAAIAEPYNREPTSPTTTATREGDGWRLDGTKTAVPAATIADAIVVTASVDGRPALFIVERGAPGLTITAQETTNREPYGYIELEGVVVNADAVVGDLATGSEAIERLQLRSTVALCATQLGVTEEGLRVTAEYTKERVQFDRPIATFQAVGHRCADAYIDVEGIRLSLWQAIENIETGSDEATVAVQTAKFWASDGGHRVAHAIVHLHGGMGIATEYFVHRYFAFAKQIEFSLGGATEQALRIGAHLAAAPA